MPAIAPAHRPAATHHTDYAPRRAQRPLQARRPVPAADMEGLRAAHSAAALTPTPAAPKKPAGAPGQPAHYIQPMPPLTVNPTSISAQPSAPAPRQAAPAAQNLMPRSQAAPRRHLAQQRPAASQAAVAPAASAPQSEATSLTPAVLARQMPIDMELPGEESRWKGGVLGRTKWRRVRRNATKALAGTMVLLILFGGFLFSQSYLKLHKVFKGGTETAAALKTNVAPELLKGEGRGRVNILLMGRGGGTHDAPNLTDTLMVASVDPVNKTATLLSVPRDLWVNVPGQGVMKLNAAWQTGAFKYLGRNVADPTDPKAIKAGYDSIDQTLKDVLGLEIDYHVLVNFQAFKQAVDTVGGIDVNVPADLVDPTMAWENGNNPVLAKAGMQSMDGTKALIYSRSRETSSDFARSERQRALLVALKAKVVNLGTLSNPMKISGLMNAFGNNVQTDLSLSNAQRLYGILKNVPDAGISSLSLADAQKPYVTTGNMNGQSIVLPKAGLFKYDDIQAFVRSQLRDPYIMKENARILILNGTSTPGLATTKADQLKSYGYNVVSVGNTPTQNWVNTTLVDLTHKKKYTKNYLEQRFGQTAATQLSDKSIATNGADFAIIIGSDEAAITQP